MIARRWTAWIATGTVIAAALLAVVLANLTAVQAPARFDLTSTGQHRLSPRTEQLLDHLGGRYEIVLAVDRSTVDRPSFDAVVDLLDGLSRRSDRLGFRLVDVGSSAGRTQFEALVATLRERDRTNVEDQAQLLAGVLDRLSSAADQFDVVAQQLDALVSGVPTDRADAAGIRRFLQQAAGLARVQAQQTRLLISDARPPLSPEGDELPDTPRLRDRLLPELDRLQLQLQTLGDQLGRYATTEAMPADSRAASGQMSRELLQRRDAIAVDAETLRRLQSPAVFRVASALESGEAALVIGPPGEGLTAIDRATLFPPVASLGGAGVAVSGEIARRAEDLFAIALTTLASPARPIVVFTHAEIEPFVLSSPSFEQLVEHIRLRGMDVLEWPVVTQSEAPGIEALNADGLRPVVYVAISPNSAAASPSQDQELSGARRASRLAGVLSSLIERGEPVLLSVNPSIFPTYGDVDPVASTLLPFGLVARTGSPLVQEVSTDRGRLPNTSLIARGVAGEEPLQQAIANLPTLMLWPMVVDLEPGPGVSATPLLALSGDDSIWMESQWINLWQAQSAPGGQPATVSFDQGRDARRASYTLAAAGERTLPGSRRTQRAVLVGSNGWALDRVAQPRAAVDGRLVAVNPGNLELFDASIAWLAGLDDEIARGVGTSNASVIKPLDEQTLTRLRWVLIAGLPVGVLAVGVLFRIVKG